MERTEELRHLPLAYAIALRLHDAGVEDARIAAALAIDQECVAPLLEVGRAKAARIARLHDVADFGRSAAGQAAAPARRKDRSSTLHREHRHPVA